MIKYGFPALQLKQNGVEVDDTGTGTYKTACTAYFFPLFTDFSFFREIAMQIELIKYLEITLSLFLGIVLAAGIFNQGKIITKLVECISLFLGDYKKKTKQAEKALRGFKEPL